MNHMANNQGKGWHGDSEGHAEASRERDRKNSNWLPLLFLPIAFVVGWAAHDASTTDTQESAQSTFKQGVGGGPDTASITPTGTSMESTDDTDTETNTNGSTGM